MKVVPIGERVFIRVEKGKEERTKSGLFLPKSDEEKKQGILAEMGFDKEGRQLKLNKGDRVLYGGYSHEEIEIDGEKHVLVEFKDVIARLED